MPEGHILHRLARNLGELTATPLSVSSPQGRFGEAARLNGTCMQAVEAYGKHLFLHFEPGAVHVHLGMQGKFLRLSPPSPPRPQVRLRLATGAVAWDLIAPSRCELLTDAALDEVVGRLGPDPLRPDADPDRVWERLHRYPGPVGAALLDQSVLAGVGNVFRAEALFAAGISPARPAQQLDRRDFDTLWQTLRSMMQRAVEEGRIITAEPGNGGDRKRLREDEGRHVYKQSRCRRCTTPVEVSSLGRRTSYACPRCQV